MKVDLVTPRFFPSVGGIEESVTQLAHGLRSLGHDVLVHTAQLPETPVAETWEKIQIRRYALRMDRGYYVSRFEPELEGDLIHLHAYAHQTNDWVIRKHAEARPIVFSTHHGIKFPKPHVWQRIYHAWYNLRTGLPDLRRADAVLVPTEVDEDEFARRRIDPARLNVIPSGVDESAFARHRAWRPPGAKREFVLFLGRIHREKGVEELVRAYGGLDAPWDLVLAGKDEGGLRRVGPLPSGVHLVTELSKQQKWGVLEACSALVLPSHYEGQGIVVAEAWAKSRPVIATRVGGLSAVVEDGRTGLLVRPRDPAALAQAMRRLMDDPALRKRLGDKGRRVAESEYRWPHIVREVEAIYRRVMKARR